MKIKIYRYVATATFSLAILLFIVDILIPHHRYWFFEIGIIAAWVLSPVGIFLSGNAFMATGNNRDVVLLTLNFISFFLFPLYMYFGTLLESIFH